MLTIFTVYNPRGVVYIYARQYSSSLPSLKVSQKWSKGKVRDKLQNAVLFDIGTYEKLHKEVPSYKLITTAIVSDRLKIRGSLARRALADLVAKGTVKVVVNHSKAKIYTRATGGDKE